MTDLTSQWKKGELPEGWYYIQEQNGDIQIDYCSRVEVDRGRIVYELEWEEFELTFSRVLAPVPSYEQWQASYNCMLENEVLRLKNAQLKEQIERLEKQLKIADSYLQVIVGLKGCKCFQCVDFARRARKKIKELENA